MVVFFVRGVGDATERGGDGGSVRGKDSAVAASFDRRRGAAAPEDYLSSGRGTGGGSPSIQG